MPKKKNEFKNQVKALAAKHGRKVNWIWKAAGFSSRQYYSLKMKNQKFTPTEQKKIMSLIINGK